MKNIIYKATVITENQTKLYVGFTGPSFKNRYTKHKYSCSPRPVVNVSPRPVPGKSLFCVF